MDVFSGMIQTMFEDTTYYFPAMCILLIIIGMFHIRKIHARHFRITCYHISASAVFFLVNYMLWQSLWAYVLALWMMLIPAVVSDIIHQSIQNRLKKVVRFAREDNYAVFAPEKAMQILKGLSPRNMTRSQLRRYERYRIYVLTHLGSLRAAKACLYRAGGDDQVVDQAHMHLLEYVLLYSSGDLAGARAAIQKAEDAVSKDTDSLIAAEIAVNRGHCHMTGGEPQIADECFQRAIRRYRAQRLKEKGLLHVLYFNYAINSTSLSRDRWKGILDEYRSMLNMDRVDDYTAFFNAKLGLLRQTGASMEEINAWVQAGFEHIQNSRLPLKNKLIFAMSTARIVWSGRMDPEPCLEVLSKYCDKLSELQPMERYHGFSQLRILFSELHGDGVARHARLRDAANAYMAVQAEKDLLAYRDALPEEAIYARCDCLRNLAILQREKEDYDADVALGYLRSATALYHENELYVEEHRYRLDILDELSSERNMDQDLQLRRPDEMKEQKEMIERFLPQISHHPVATEFYLRLSFYCSILEDYEGCVLYYQHLRQTALGLNHFAPWLHRYYMLVLFTVRVYHFKKTIEAIRASAELGNYSEKAQQWFASFPHHDGVFDSMLLARYLDRDATICQIKVKCWLEAGKTALTTHGWLWLDGLKLNADVTYEQFTREADCRRILFDADTHPFESDKSWTIQRDLRETGLAFRGVQLGDFSYLKLQEADRSLFDEVYKQICAHEPENSPDMSELKEMYLKTMLPVRAAGTGIHTAAG